MASIQIGKYKRPGIFFEEFDLSIIPPPAAPAPLASSLVVGFSKKGPINTPILISNVDELEKVYGPLDRTLERKGSFFHRTIAKILETSPVLAMNLLPTSDTLDKVEYISLSTATNKTNSPVIEIPFRKIHDTSGFWTRDTDTFIDNIKDQENGIDRLFHITNISNRYTTLFIFKSKITGFNQSLIEYYGTAEKVPPYLSPLDYASDYLVDVLAVGGDWSNYQSLAADIRWSAYFTTDGLDKASVRAFASDRNVNTLAFYEGLSLIPFFRDSDGRNIFIETVINNETDRTGLFCAFDGDKLEQAYRTDYLDLIGNNFAKNNSLIDIEQDTIEFLSYTAPITEQVRYDITPLDLLDGVQKVVALGPSISGFGPSSLLTRTDAWYPGGRPNSNDTAFGTLTRTTYHAEEVIRGVRWASQSSIMNVAAASSSITIGFQFGTVSYGPSTESNAFFVLNGQKKFISYTEPSGVAGPTGFSLFTFSIPLSDYTVPTSATATYYTTFYIDYSTGQLKKAQGTAENIVPTLPSNDDLALGTVRYSIVPSGAATVDKGYFAVSGVPGSMSFVEIGVNRGGLLSVGGLFSPGSGTGFTASFSEIPVSVTDLGDSIIQVTFTNTAVTDANGGGTSVAIYEQHRRIRLFNQMVSLLDNPNKSKVVMLKNLQTREKFSLANSTISSIVKSSTANKSFILNLGLGEPTPTDIAAGNLVMYATDNEFFPGSEGFESKMTVASSTYGVAGYYSEPYLGFVNGDINVGDYFYTNLISPTFSRNFGNLRVTFTESTEGESVVVFSGPRPRGASSYYDSLAGTGHDSPWFIGGTESFIVPSSSSNYKVFTIIGAATNSIVDPSTATGSNFIISASWSSAWKLDKSTTLEDLTGVDTIWDANNKVYLSAYTNDAGFLTVEYTADDLTTVSYATQSQNYSPIIISDLSNFKQTLEIVEPAGYIPVENKILVNAARYTEIRLNMFLQAKVVTDELASAETGRRLTRILNKRAYSGDPTLAEITCDSAIQKYTVGDSLQTLAYTTIDEYVNTYKAIRLKGFRIREEVLPDGTEAKQSAILNMVAKGTAIFKALVNKDAIDYRYVVDSFGLGLISDSKQQLVDICGERLDCFGFLNMPSIRYFKSSTNPSFTNTDGTLNTAYIANGGNEEANPSFLYSFGKGKGVSSVAYFLPYLIVNDNGRPAEVPPAPYVASTYLRKFSGVSTSLVPWTIAAGVNNGRILNITGVETSFSFEDIENLNLAQMNPIVFKKNRGFAIETENTAQVIYKSALSYIHVREVLIELERELTAMLLDYQWRFNTSDVRAEIKLKADGICEKYVNKNGLYNYFNKCDEENNTPDLIDRQIGVIDTFVEPIKGMGIIVNNVTILRTGAIESGGFA